MTGPQPQRRSIQPPTDTSWHAKSECRKADPELFYHPENETGTAKERRIDAAKAVCNKCPVLATCRANTLHEQFGIWGGLSEDERTAIRAGSPAGMPAHLHIVPYAMPATKRARTLDPEPVIAHLNTLIDAGFNPTAIARFIGISPDTVRAIVRGLKKEIFPHTAEQLLSVQVRREAAA